jgi:hypothetical protein
MDSIAALSLLPENSINVFYLDADHSYPAVKADLLAGLPKIRDDGFVCGHDYNEKDFPGCVQAIHEVVGKPEKVYADNSWMIRKAAICPDAVC